MSTERFKNVTSFVINLLNNKTIILLNLAEYRLILARPRRLNIRRHSARFRRIIVKHVQIIPCAVRIAHLWLKSAKVQLTSDSFAQPKQHVQYLVFPRLQRQMSRNLLQDKDAENTKRSTKVAKQIWKDFLLEKMLKNQPRREIWL